MHGQASWKKSLVGVTSRNVPFLVWRSALKTNDNHLQFICRQKAQLLNIQRTRTWLVCMICTCDLFSRFIFYAHDPKCLQRRHWRISKRRLLDFSDVHCTPASLALRCFPVVAFCLARSGTVTLVVMWPPHYWSLSSTSSPQRGGVQPQTPAARPVYVHCLPRSTAHLRSGSCRVP